MVRWSGYLLVVWFGECYYLGIWFYVVLVFGNFRMWGLYIYLLNGGGVYVMWVEFWIDVLFVGGYVGGLGCYWK